MQKFQLFDHFMQSKMFDIKNFDVVMKKLIVKTNNILYILNKQKNMRYRIHSICVFAKINSMFIFKFETRSRQKINTKMKINNWNDFVVQKNKRKKNEKKSFIIIHWSFYSRLNILFQSFDSIDSIIIIFQNNSRFQEIQISNIVIFTIFFVHIFFDVRELQIIHRAISKKHVKKHNEMIWKKRYISFVSNDWFELIIKLMLLRLTIQRFVNIKQIICDVERSRSLKSILTKHCRKHYFSFQKWTHSSNIFNNWRFFFSSLTISWKMTNVKR